MSLSLRLIRSMEPVSEVSSRFDLGELAAAYADQARPASFVGRRWTRRPHLESALRDLDADRLRLAAR
jgi:hypothetical protein